MQLAKIKTMERRRCERRDAESCRTITSHQAFDREERLVFKELERRKALRRATDVRRAVAKAV